MKILNYPQYSMIDNGVFKVDNDSTTEVFITLLKYLKLAKVTCEVVHLFPIGTNDTLLSHSRILEVVEHTNISIDFIYYPFESNPINSRYEFNYSLLHKIFSNEKFTHVWNHIPELSRNFRALLRDYTPYKLISFHHFPDLGSILDSYTNSIDYKYFPRQHDGYEVSDMNVFNMRYTEQIFNAHVTPNNSTHLSYVDFNSFELDHFGIEDTEPTIVFTSRLTSTMYTNWHLAARVFDELQQFKLVFTNPSGEYGYNAFVKEFGEPNKIENGGAEEDTRAFWGDNIIVHKYGVSKKKYEQICRRADGCLNLYADEYYGGISQREAFMWGKNSIPIMINKYMFSHWYSSSISKSILIDNIDDFNAKSFLKYYRYFENEVNLTYMKELVMSYEHFEYYNGNFDKILNA